MLTASLRACSRHRHSGNPNRQATYTNQNIVSPRIQSIPRLNRSIDQDQITPVTAGLGHVRYFMYMLVRYGTVRKNENSYSTQRCMFVRVLHSTRSRMATVRSKKYHLYELPRGKGQAARSTTSTNGRNRVERNAHARATNRLSRKRIDHALTFPRASSYLHN